MNFSESLNEEKDHLKFLLKCITFSSIFLVNHMVYRYFLPSQKFTYAISALLATAIIFVPIFCEALKHF